MRVLIIDNESTWKDWLSESLQREGFEVDKAENGEIATSMLDEDFYDVAIIDLNIPKIDGMTVLKHLVDHHHNSIGIILTGYATVGSVVEAMKIGAYDYLAKPVTIEEILNVIKRSLEFRAHRQKNFALTNRLYEKYRFEDIIGASMQMRKVFQIIEKVATSDSTILILGESGTGKELVAKAIHRHSLRREKPFKAINCNAIPDNLIESELFGHEKGAFTHAIRTRIGRLELADGGTIFLDEVAEMSPRLQVKLLRVLQEHEFERLGNTKTIKCNIRILAATNKDLDDLVQSGFFREDLYYRLSVVPIHIPPLRARPTDIPLLVHHFLDVMSKAKKKKIKGISKDIVDSLIRYDWPGNVRELEHVIERMVILSDDDYLTRDDLPEEIAKKQTGEYIEPNMIPDEGFSLSHAVNEYEKELIINALEKADWVKNRAAKLLNLNPTTMVEKMKRQRIEKQVRDSAF